MNILESFSDLNYPEGVIYDRTFSILDSSKLQLYMECPRQYFYRYILGWTTCQRDVHLIHGAAIHTAIETMLNGGSWQEGFAIYFEHYQKELGKGPYDQYTPKTPDKARQALQAYSEHYNDDWELLYTEVCGKVPIMLEPYRLDLTLRIDAVVRDSRGIIVIDHKTASRVDRLWEAQFALSVQANCYLYAASAHWGWEKIYGVLINGLVFYKRQKEPYGFKRVMVRRSCGAMEQWLMTVRTYVYQLIDDMYCLEGATIDTSTMRVNCKDGLDKELFPQNPKSCTLYGRVCPYLDMCEAWHNPLKHVACGEIPDGFEIKRWDPAEIDFNYELTDKGVKETKR